MSPITTLETVRAHRGAGAEALRTLDRAARTPVLLDAPADAAARARDLRVGIVGLGSIGSHAGDLLARSSVASLLLIDRARVRPESLLTHPLKPGDIGRSKARRAGKAAKQVSPDTAVRVFHGAVESLPVGAFAGLSAVVLASDNLACELEVSQRCLHLGIPLIHASVHGPTLVAQVRALSNASEREGAGACLACGFGRGDWRHLDANTQFPCAGGETSPERSRIPTVSPAWLCATAACLAVTELVGRACGVRPTEDRLIEYCGYTHGTVVSPLERDAECPMDHSLWQVERRTRAALGASTPRALLQAAASPMGAGAGADMGADTGPLGQDLLVDASLTVGGHCFTRLATCACSPHPVLGRFVAQGDPPQPCAGCGGPLGLHPLYTHEQVPGLALREHLDQTLAQLGARDVDSVLVRLGQRAVLFHARPRQSAPGAPAPRSEEHPS